MFVATHALFLFAKYGKRTDSLLRGGKPACGRSRGWRGTSRVSVLPPPCDLGEDSNGDGPGRSNLPVARTGGPGGIP